MTHDPITIGRGDSLNSARRVMLTHRIRHLPVVHEGRLVGILSEGDVARFDRTANVNQNYAVVGQAMTPSPYTVGPYSPLRETVDQMACRRCGSAVVVEGEHVVGLLTATDGLHALSVVLGEHIKQAP
jgi:acetoin utilization protein AcuB